jgi:hypothetical protein
MAEPLDPCRLIRQGAVFAAKPISTIELQAAIEPVTGRGSSEGGRP